MSEIENNRAARANATESDEKGLVVATSRDGLIRRQNSRSVFILPLSSEKYGGFAYSLPNDRIMSGIRESEAPGAHELCHMLKFLPDETIEVSRGGDSFLLSGAEMAKALDGTRDADYARRAADGKRFWLRAAAPLSALAKDCGDKYLFRFPETSELSGYSYFASSKLVSLDEDAGQYEIRLPEDGGITIWNRREGRKIRLSARGFRNILASNFESYSANADAPSKWATTVVSKEAAVRRLEKATLFKMPKSGEYRGYCYCMPNKLVRASGENIELVVGRDFEIELKDVRSGRVKKISSEAFIGAVGGTEASEYRYLVSRFRAGDGLFPKFEEKLSANVPRTLKNRRNWVCVSSAKDVATGKIRKYPINPETGEFAKIDDPSTWSTYDRAFAAAKDNGLDAVAYALDGKDGICCIDVDGCVGADGRYSDAARALLDSTGKTYCERSLSGTGLHFFMRTEGLDVRAFSRDGSMEFYRAGHFIAMTGDTLEGRSSLRSLEKTDALKIVLDRFDRREPARNAGSGEAGLSRLSDREVLDKALNANDGGVFAALYRGVDIKNNHSNSDMCLMNRLAFWCNGDKEQMLRIFESSGLYRPEKSGEYYEGTAIKATRWQTERYRGSRKAELKVPTARRAPERSGSRAVARGAASEREEKSI